MKFAFSTVACPNWDFQTIAARAKEYGYDGVEIRAFLNEAGKGLADLFKVGVADVASIFKAAGVEIACLSTSICFTGDGVKDEQAGLDLRKSIDAAASLGCPLVKIFDTQVRPGQSQTRRAVEMGQWLLPHLDHASMRNVSVVVENALSFRRASELWMVLETVNHPSAGAAWDLFNAAQVGEQPSVSVPTLNSRILYTQVKDAKLAASGATFTKLGEGDVPVKRFLIKLLGVGYKGYVTVEWDKLWLPNLAEPEEILPDALTKLKEWTKPPELKPAKKPAAVAKPAVPAAPAAAKA